MTVIDLLSLITDSTNVWIVDSSGFPLSQYNGKDSIDERFNDCIIAKVYTDSYGLNIVIQED